MSAKRVKVQGNIYIFCFIVVRDELVIQYELSRKINIHYLIFIFLSHRLKKLMHFVYIHHIIHFSSLVISVPTSMNFYFIFCYECYKHKTLHLSFLSKNLNNWWIFIIFSHTIINYTSKYLHFTDMRSVWVGRQFNCSLYLCNTSNVSRIMT